MGDQSLQVKTATEDVLCRGRTGDEVSMRGKPLSDLHSFFDVGASRSSLSSSADRLSVSESSLVQRLFSSASNFSVCSIIDQSFSVLEHNFCKRTCFRSIAKIFTNFQSR